MTPQLQQVAQTYLTRRAAWIVAAFVAFTWVFSLIAPSLLTDEPVAAAPLAGLAAAVTGYALGIQAKWQFCNPRARLLPDFKRPHLAVPAAILVVCCLVYPLAVAQAARWSPLGALAFSIAGTAAGIWAMHRPSALTIAPAFCIFLSFGTPPTINFYVLPAPTPTISAARLAILAVAWGSIAYWLHRLSVLGEEDVDYLIPVLAQDGTRVRPVGKQASRPNGATFILGSWQSRLADTWRYSAPNVATTIADRQRLLGDGPLAAPPWIRAIGLATMFLAMLLIAPLIALGFSAVFGLDVRDNEQVVGVIILMTAAMGGSQLEQRRPRMSQELMLPLRRQDYFNGLFAGAARHAFAIWITTLAAVIAYIALLIPDRFFLGSISAVAAISLGLHAFMFGAFINIASQHSGNARFAAYVIVLSLAVAPLTIASEELPQPVVTAAEREQLEQAVQERYFDLHGKIDKFLQPETKQQLLVTIRKALNPHGNDPPAKTYVPWICAALLTVAGVAAFFDGRKRWLHLELG